MRVAPVYAAVRLCGEPVECERLHEPVGGWAWVRCSDAGALLREVARSMIAGCTALVATPSGPLDPLEVERRLAELESPVVDGYCEVLVGSRSPVELLELGAVSVEWRPGSPVAKARFRSASAVRLLERGFIPLVWTGRRG